ncbi:MAG: two-component response regulator [Cytophagaceae bacterium]|jgi:CheY-like chemotaxis protein|nr:two-component response regulator [Cytophagaceae bacterium]
MKRIDSVLLVDDDEVCNFISVTLLKHLHLSESIHSVTNGNEALRFLKENAVIETATVFPEVIFLDLNMPVMDGFGFLEQLNKTMPAYASVCKIFILTSSESPLDIDRCRRYDIAGYISKPLTEEKLEVVAR